MPKQERRSAGAACRSLTLSKKCPPEVKWFSKNIHRGIFKEAGDARRGIFIFDPPPIVIFSLKRAVEAQTFETNLFQKFKQKLF